jgi:putative SOS response-associated peptidase YedK
MCGRYVTISKLKAIEKRFNITTPQPELYAENTNVCIGEYAPVITDSNPRELSFYKFGFTPSWANKQMYLFNARAEGDHNPENDPRYHGAKGIISKPVFRKAIRSQRCLVVADAYIEGPEKEKLSKPYVVYKKNGERPFAFAGLWDVWTNKDTGEEVHSFAIITTTSCDVTAKIGHHRSPVILPKEAEAAWLSHDVPLEDITSLLQPSAPHELNAYPISAAIKSPKAKGLDLLKPTGQRVFAEYDYELYQELQLEGMGMTQARKRANEKN